MTAASDARARVLAPLVAASLACTSPSSAPSPATTPTRAADPEPANVLPAAPEPAATPHSEPPRPSEPPRLGLREPPLEHNALADSHHAAGLRLHREGDYAGARAAFIAASRADPGHVWARYELARVQSRLGELDTALALLDPLLHEDLATFGPRIDVDEDLAALRESSLAPELAVLRQRALDRYLDVLRQGPFATQGDDDDLRVGVYEPRERRLVAFTPAREHALVGALDREAGRALLLSGRLEWDGNMVEPLALGVHLFDLAQPGRVVTELRALDLRRHVGRGPFTSIEAAIEGDAVRLSFVDASSSPPRSVGLWIEGIEASAKVSAGPDLRLDRDTLRVVIVDREAYALEPSPAELRLDGVRLTIPGRRTPLVLRGHEGCDWHHVTRTSDQRFVLIESLRSSCDPAALDLARIVSRYDAQTDTLEQLADIESSPRLAGDGSVYVEGDEYSSVLHPGDEAASLGLPQHIGFQGRHPSCLR